MLTTNGKLGLHTSRASSSFKSESHPGVLRRHGANAPAVVRPVRDCAARDLALACRMWRLGTAPRAPNPRASSRGRPSLNALAAAFVVGLQAALPSTVPTLLRTALKLQAFPFNQMPGAGEPGGGGGGSTAVAELEGGGDLASGCTGSQACVCSAAPGSGSGWDGAGVAAASQACVCSAAAGRAGSRGGECAPAASRCAAGQAGARSTDAESAGGRSTNGAPAASDCSGNHAHAHGAAAGSGDARQGKRSSAASGCASSQAQSAAPGAGSACGSEDPGAALGLCAICAAPLSEHEALGAHERSLAGQGPGAGSRSRGPGLGYSAPAMHPACCGSSGAGAAAASEAGMEGDATACNFRSACCYACRQLILAAPRGAPGAARADAGAGGCAVASLLPALLRGTARAAGCLRLPPAVVAPSAGCVISGEALRAQIAQYLLDGA